MPALEERRWTALEVRGLPEDGGRHEVVDGELLVTPAPPWPHQIAVLQFFTALNDYLRAEAAGMVLVAPADVEVDASNMVQPDVFVVPLIEGRRPLSWREAERMLLAIEVLSPASRRSDRVVKRPLYQSMGAEYWIVDLEAELVERWLPGDDRPSQHTSDIEWHAESAEASVRIDLRGLFAAALGRSGDQESRR